MLIIFSVIRSNFYATQFQNCEQLKSSNKKIRKKTLHSLIKQNASNYTTQQGWVNPHYPQVFSGTGLKILQHTRLLGTKKLHIWQNFLLKEKKKEREKIGRNVQEENTKMRLELTLLG